jgi:cellulose synthase/poly-beta-1,6-N-acetylglucosamine synthase-like glycosyltransferase
MIAFLTVYFLVYFGIFGFMLYRFYAASQPETVTFPIEKVKVSILIAARNEAENIIQCLTSLSNLNYPSELLEVLIGDDNSADETAKLVTTYIQDKPNFRLISIKERLGTTKGKANVLAHLTKAATAEYFFITDADMVLPENWITAMLARLTPETGIVTGITTVNGRNFFARMQQLDWLQALGFIQVVSDLGLSVTTMGNNMLITRQAYESTGGYENMPFSITEDIQLFNEVLKQGYTSINVFKPETLAVTQPIKTFKALLHQRKRWMRGTTHLPAFMKVFFTIYASFYLFLLLAFWYLPFGFGLGILGLKMFFQSMFLVKCLRIVNRSLRFSDFLYFEFYQVIIAATLLLFYFLPVKVNWKDRQY